MAILIRYIFPVQLVRQPHSSIPHPRRMLLSLRPNLQQTNPQLWMQHLPLLRLGAHTLHCGHDNIGNLSGVLLLFLMLRGREGGWAAEKWVAGGFCDHVYYYSGWEDYGSGTVMWCDLNVNGIVNWCKNINHLMIIL